MIVLTEAEERAILYERKRRAAQEERERRERELSVLRREGRFTAKRYSGGHHSTYAVYDGEELICVCVYKRGAFSLMDYLIKNLTSVRKDG